jgi:hypothetical protein
MTADCRLPGSPTIGRYLGVVVLDVVRGERIIGGLMLNVMHVWTFVEDCIIAGPIIASNTKQGQKQNVTKMTSI